MRRTAARLGFRAVLAEELAKVGPLARFFAKDTKDRAYGVDGLSQEQADAKQRHYEEMRKVDADAQRHPDPTPVNATWSERAAAVRSQLAATFGPKAGMAAVINHCAKAHAAEVAVAEDIDVKNVTIVTETASVEEGTKIVGYIEAPAATEEEVFVYAAKLTNACPAARTHGGVEWRHGPPPAGW